MSLGSSVQEPGGKGMKAFVCEEERAGRLKWVEMSVRHEMEG